MVLTVVVVAMIHVTYGSFIMNSGKLVGFRRVEDINDDSLSV